MGRSHGGFPYLAFLQLAVSAESEDPGWAFRQPGSQGHAYSDGNALPQGTGGNLNSGAVIPAGVSLEDRAQLPEGFKCGFIKTRNL